MISWSQGERLKREAADLRRYSISMSLVLSLIASLAFVAIASTNALAGDLWIALTACAVPIPLGLYFRKGIVQLGPFVYIAILILLFCAAFLFGIWHCSGGSK